MKIKKAEDVQVGDVMVIGGIEWTCVDPSISYWNTPCKATRLIEANELQDLIDHGFEVTRKVEPVVFEATVYDGACGGKYICLPEDAEVGQLVKASLEPL